MLADRDIEFMSLAINAALKGRSEGGIPIGAALVSHDGRILSTGYNRRVQLGKAMNFSFKTYLCFQLKGLQFTTEKRTH